MERNVIWAIVVSMLIVMIWFKVTTPQKSAQTAHMASMESAATIVASSAEKIEREEEKIVADYSYILENESNRIEINSSGGIKSWKVKEQNNVVELIVDPEKAPLTLSPSLIFEQEPHDIISGKKIELAGRMGDDISVNKTFTFEKDGMLGITIALTNTSSKRFSISNMSIGLGPGLGTDDKSSSHAMKRELRAVMMDNGKIHKKVKPNEYDMHYGWIGIDNRYFMSALIEESGIFKRVRAVKGYLPHIAYTGDVVLEPSETKKLIFKTYWGLKKYNTLKQFDLGLEKTIDMGLFSDLVKFFAFVLHKLYGITNNYGWAIVFLTTLIQLVLFPLTKKSAGSMQSMKRLQPEINNLRAKYKDDPKKMNMEIMTLYRTKKVNPFSGCFPLFLQIPIFWGLFTMLRSAVELRHAPFIFWIKDLSAPDTVFRIGSVPINILPLVMGGLMFLSSELTSATSDPTQRKMMIFLPLIFTFMFWGFPSGLVLYWLVSNVYTICINLWITKRHHKETAVLRAS